MDAQRKLTIQLDIVTSTWKMERNKFFHVVNSWYSEQYEYSNTQARMFF